MNKTLSHRSPMRHLVWYFPVFWLALILRMTGIDFGLPYRVHPDEPFYAYCGGLLRMYQTATFDIRCGYPPGYLVVQAATQLLGERDQTPWVEEPITFALSRRISVLTGILAIALASSIAKRLIGEPAGIAALLLLSVNPLIVNHARYATPDNFYALFSLASVVLSHELRRAPQSVLRIRLQFTNEMHSSAPCNSSRIEFKVSRPLFVASLAFGSAAAATLMKYQAAPLMVLPVVSLSTMRVAVSTNIRRLLILFGAATLFSLWLWFGYGVLRVRDIPGGPLPAYDDQKVFLPFLSWDQSWAELAAASGGRNLVWSLTSAFALMGIWPTLRRRVNWPMAALALLALFLVATALTQFPFYGLRQWLPGVMLVVTGWSIVLVVLIVATNRLVAPIASCKSWSIPSVAVAIAFIFMIVVPWARQSEADAFRLEQKHTLAMLGDWFEVNVPSGTVMAEYSHPFLREYGYPGEKTFDVLVVDSLLDVDMDEMRFTGIKYLIANELAGTRGGYFAHPDNLSFLSKVTLLKELRSTSGNGPRYAVFYAQPIQVTANANFAEDISLIGYTLESKTINAGEPVQVTLFWRASGKAKVSYNVFVHLFQLVNGEPFIWGQHDGVPANGMRPTTSWDDQDEIIVDQHLVPIGPGVREGRYQLQVGLYDWRTGERLSVVNPTTGELATSVVLSAIQITGSSSE